MTKLNTIDVIKHSAYEVKHNGYVKRSDAKDDCTSDKIFDMITHAEIDESELDAMNEYITEWMNYIQEQQGEYFDDLRNEVAKPFTDEKRISLIASSFASYERYLKFGKQMKQECNSEYLGEEGESIEFTVSDHKLLKKGTSKFKNGNSSNWFLYKIIDDAGNVIMAFMDHNCEFEFNHCNKIKATISKLSEFNNVKQTSVTRVKFLD